MGFKSLIQAQVKAALKLIGDLGVSATFSNTSSVAYNFGSQETTSTVSSTIITILETGRRRGSTDTSPTIVTVIADSTTTGGLDQYDTLTYSGNTYKVSSLDDDGYITTITIIREA